MNFAANEVNKLYLNFVDRSVDQSDHMTLSHDLCQQVRLEASVRVGSVSAGQGTWDQRVSAPQAASHVSHPTG